MGIKLEEVLAAEGMDAATGIVPEELPLLLTVAGAKLGAGITLEAVVPMFEVMMLLVLWLIVLLPLAFPLLAPPGVLPGEHPSFELF